MTRLTLATLAVLAVACSAPSRSAAVSPQPVAAAPAPRPVERPKPPTRPMGSSAYEEGMAALSRFMKAPDCDGADLRVVVEKIADLQRTIALFDPSQTPSVRDLMLAHQAQARERHASLAFALADGALESGCLDAADQAYRRIISYYTGSAYSGIRERAKLGIDDVRAARAAEPFAAGDGKEDTATSETHEQGALGGIEGGRGLENRTQALGAKKTERPVAPTLYQRYDEIDGITWMCHMSMPILSPYASLAWIHYKQEDPSTHSTYMALYFGVKDGSPSALPLRMKVQYYGTVWLFARQLTIKADAQTFEMPRREFKRDHSSGAVWEWLDIEISDHAMLRAIMDAERVLVRFRGPTYYHDWILPESQQVIMRQVADAWATRRGTK